MKTVFLAWQHTRPDPAQRPATRAWFPIGRLDHEDGFFRFTYTQGAERAKLEAGFAPLASFPDLQKTYEAPELFSVFRNRVMQSTREDYQEYLAQMGLAGDGVVDPLEIMSISGGSRQTDNLEVFPKIQKRRDGGFSCRFFLHGWRHANEHAKARIAQLVEGEPLSVALELNNPVTQEFAIQLQTTNDYHMIGWTPRYLIQDLLTAMSQCPGCLQATVARLNPAPAPYTQRVLVHLEGTLPAGMEPMSGPDFQPMN